MIEDTRYRIFRNENVIRDARVLIVYLRGDNIEF